MAGATGFVGRLLVTAIGKANDLELVSAVAKTNAGRNLSAVVPEGPEIIIQGDVESAMAARPDVLIDYTHPDVVKAHVLTALQNGVHAVIGTSGLNEADYDEIDAAARKAKTGVIAAGNFSITAALLLHFAQIAAAHCHNWEIFDFGTATKPDAPSGTARELAYKLSLVGEPELGIPLSQVLGAVESRGATLNGCQVHSVRLPGYYSAVETVFGLPDERLTIRHDSSSSGPYVAGTLLAARKVGGYTGLHRGLDKLLGLSTDDSR